jgi:hypothetical protein
MPAEFWRVYNYLALQWYETEFGVSHDCWYFDAMVFLEDLAATRTGGAR